MPSTTAVSALCLYCAGVGYASFAIVQWVDSRRSKGSYPQYSEFSVVLVLGPLFVIAHRICQVMMTSVARAVIIRKSSWTAKAYEHKLTRFGSAIFKFVFFSVFSAYFFFTVLLDADWMPPILFGGGSTKNCWGEGRAGDTQHEVGTYLSHFYMLALAYHLSEVVFQIIYERDKPDLAEMLCHHVTTLFLVFTSFLANFVRIGTLVLFVHYVSDIPIYGAKIFVDTSCKMIAFLFLLGCILSWGFLRLYVFPAVIIRSTLMESIGERESMGEACFMSFNGALCVLVCLHMYWYSLFLKMGYFHLFKGETKDVQLETNLSEEMDPKTAEQTQCKMRCVPLA